MYAPHTRVGVPPICLVFEARPACCPVRSPLGGGRKADGTRLSAPRRAGRSAGPAWLETGPLAGDTSESGVALHAELVDMAAHVRRAHAKHAAQVRAAEPERGGGARAASFLSPVSQ